VWILEKQRNSELSQHTVHSSARSLINEVVNAAGCRQLCSLVVSVMHAAKKLLFDTFEKSKEDRGQLYCTLIINYQLSIGNWYNEEKVKMTND